MKRIFVPILNSLLLSVILLPATGQTVSAELDKLTELIKPVTIKDINYDQSISFEESDGYILNFTSTESKKNTTSSFRFNLLDIPTGDVELKVRKNIAEIEIGTVGNKRLILESENNELDSYVSKFSIKSTGIEEARQVVEQFKKAIDLLSKQNITLFEDKNEIVELLSYLESQIGTVKLNDDNFEQAFEYKTDLPSLVTFVVNDLSKSENESGYLNFYDVDPNKISYFTKGIGVYVEFETLANKNLIAVSNNDKMENYKGKFTIMAESVEQGKKLEAALKNLKELSSQHQPKPFDNKTEWPATLDFVSAGVVPIQNDVTNIRQNLEVVSLKDGLFKLNMKQIEKDKEEVFSFNASDIDLSKINYETKGSNVIVEVSSILNKNMFGYIENGETQNYQRQFEIQMPDIESARSFVQGFQHLVMLAKKRTQEFTIAGKKNPDIPETLNFLVKTIGDFNYSETSVSQSLFYDVDKPEIVTYEIIEPEKDRRWSYLFNIKDLSKSTIGFDTKGKEVFFNAETNKKEDLIKVIKNNDEEKYEDTLEILAPDIESARAVNGAFLHLISLVNAN